MKKFIFLFCISILLINVLIPSNNVSANVALRVVGGTVAEAVMVGVAEKIGTNLGTNTARQKSLQRWNYDLDWYYKQQDDEMIERIVRMDKLSSELDSAVSNKIPLVNKPGYSKVILSAAAFLTAADIIYEGYSAFKVAKENEEFTQLLVESMSTGSAIESYQGLHVYFSDTYTLGDMYRIGVQKSDGTYIKASLNDNFGFYLTGTKPLIYFEITSIVSGSLNIKAYGRGTKYDNTSLIQNLTGSFPVASLDITQPIVELFQPTEEDVPVVKMPPSLVPLEEPSIDATPELIPLPDNVEIIIPDDLTILSPESPYVPSNDPLIDSEPEPGPETNPEPTDVPEHSDWWEWLLSPLAKILEWLQKIWEAIKALVGDLLTGLVSLFVPSEGYFEDLFKDIKAKFDLKLPLISQLTSFFIDIKDATFNSSIPTFEIRVPDDWGGGLYSIIDFKYFMDYRVWILNFIRFTAWYFFLKRVYNRIPSVVY